jgi:hypothetical protein
VRALLACGALVLAGPGACLAQTIQELERLILERDVRIERLQRRIEQLEEQAVKPADAEEMNRALERALVQQGGLLLPGGSYEIEPQFSYAHWDKSRSALRYESEAALSLRAGLPAEFQVQVRAPYVHVSTSESSEEALGDVEAALSRQVGRGDGLLPSLVGTLGWRARTGKDAFADDIPTGSGFDALQAGLTALKRRDPLVYYGGLSYSAPRARDIDGVKVDPGDALGVRLGGILAARPDTSVSMGLSLSFVRATRLDGERVPESDTTLGVFQIGVGTILTRRTMLNVSADLRVTGEVPDFRLSLTLPVRF